MKFKDIALDGVVRQNPVFKLVLGTCPTLAVTVSMSNALGMGLAVIFVLCLGFFLWKKAPRKFRLGTMFLPQLAAVSYTHLTLPTILRV